MAWVESHTVLIRHRKLKELALLLRLKPVYVLGHLHVLWHDALEQQEDGDLSAWSDELIAESAGYDGDAPQFVSLLQDRGWLDGRLIHDWLDYAGRYLESKYRTSNPERLKEIWSKHGLVWQESGNRRTKDRPPNLTLPNQPNQPTPAPAGAFEVIWAKYPRRDGKKAAERHFNASVKTMKDWLDIQNALDNYLSQLLINHTELKFTKMGSTWFNNWRENINYKLVMSEPAVRPTPRPIMPRIVETKPELTPAELEENHRIAVKNIPGFCRDPKCLVCKKGVVREEAKK